MFMLSILASGSKIHFIYNKKNVLYPDISFSIFTYGNNLNTVPAYCKSNQEEEMKRMNNSVQGVSNRGCWKTRQYNVQCQERNQEEERKNR